MAINLRIYHSNIIGQTIIFIHRNSLVIFMFLAILITIFCQYNKVFNNLLSNFIISSTKPLYSMINFPINLYNDFNYNLKKIFISAKEYERLKRDNDLLRNSVTKLSFLEQENKLLKLLLKYNNYDYNNYVTSRIYINNGLFKKVAVIDKGLIDNLKVGQAVVTVNGMVGRILEVYKNYSHILLLTDFNSRIPIYSSESREKAIMIGRNSNYPKLKYLNKNHKIVSNEIIYSSGDGLIYPADIPIGISLIDENNEVIVIPFVKFNKLQFIKILTLP